MIIIIGEKVIHQTIVLIQTQQNCRSLSKLQMIRLLTGETCDFQVLLLQIFLKGNNSNNNNSNKIKTTTITQSKCRTADLTERIFAELSICLTHSISLLNFLFYTFRKIITT